MAPVHNLQLNTIKKNMSMMECTHTVLQAAGEKLRDVGPVYMVNLVRYREKTVYEEPSTLPSCSGREAYFQRYAHAFKTITQGEDYCLFWVGHVHGVLVGTDGEAWDDIVIVRYASFSVLRRILESPAYAEQAKPHRIAALADWKFIVTTQPEMVP